MSQADKTIEPTVKCSIFRWLPLVAPTIFCAMSFAQFPPQIKNIVVIVQENRTPDNLFHFLTPACRLVEPRRGNASCIPAEAGYSITEKENGG